MDSFVNHLGQPVGFPVPDWHPPSLPARAALSGRYCRIEPLDTERHADDLFSAYGLDREGRLWTYLPVGPFESLRDCSLWMDTASRQTDPLHFAIVERSTGKATGMAAFLRIDPKNGSIEVGWLCFSPLLQRTVSGTEAMFLMMDYAFSLGFRRYEWKCNALNAPSRAAARRLGFTFEGIFRQATVVKGHNRDTAWYSILDREWPDLKKRFLEWLDPENFDSAGRQKNRLALRTDSPEGNPDDC
ncbi:MAG: GNAT family N-acetyltransferase [Nitrospirae bacterium]|nr:GNAT family N-acetyltransferase [Nitrospirota bacterium]MCL5286061.1 GNAT family N-acetyltransferase [Nitrospirota bacterium]